MDDEIELILPDNLDDSDVGGIFPDFSQVQIQVHGSDVAEKIIEDVTSHTENHEAFDNEEYLDPHIDYDVEEISDNYPDQIHEETETITEDFTENFLAEQTHEDNVEKYANIHDKIDVTDNDDYHEENLDNIERIPDKDISEYDAVIEEYPNYRNMAIKEEIEPFIGTDYTDFDASPLEEHSGNDLPPEDVYHSNNVILGSKPCKTTSQGILRRLLQERDSIEETNKVKKEHLNAVVLLEDWGANLQKSDSFCEVCGTLFVTPNDFDAHKMMAHSFLVPVSKNVAVKSTTKSAFARKIAGTVSVKSNKNIARKSTGTKAMGSTFCNHCNKVFSDHTTLIKHLYELLPLKQFACSTCDLVFQTQKDLTDHNIVHVKPERVKVTKEKIDKKGANLKKKILYEEDVKKTRPILPTAEFEAIPKSVLFKCPKCCVHFVTAMTGFRHNIYCDSTTTRRKPINCTICHRKIHAKDFNIHKKQHKMCTKFRVYKVHKDLSEKILCKCLNCDLHFSDCGMNLHLKDCGKIHPEHCQKCNLLMPRSKYYSHMRMHKQHNLKPKDFIIIHYYIQQCAVKRKMEPPNTPAKKTKLDYSQKVDTNKKLQAIKSKTEPRINVPTEGKIIQKVKKGMLGRHGNKFRMYFCTLCKGCCYLNSHREIHLKKHCLSTGNVKTRVICPECGLQFSRTTIWYHRSLHKKELTIHNVSFFDLHTLARTMPSIPDYPQCTDCKIKFFELKIQGEHICGEDYETCNICCEKYHNSAYEAHIEFHKLIETQPTKVKTKLIPERMHKYKSLNKMWNIVYGCKNCDIITDQYDKAVEHSQGHFNNELSTTNIKCYICNLKFDETCWSKHSELHSQMNINSTDFNILMYNPQKLLTEDWFELFHSLPKELIRQVTDKSVYGYERRFKMKLLKEGRSEFTVYCCSDCKVACRNNEIEKHINNTCKNSTNICKICSIPFSDISTLRNHQILHIKGIKKEEFRVVIFTKQQAKIKAKQQTKTKVKQKSKTKATYKTKQLKLLRKRKKGLITISKFGNKSFRGVQIDSSGKYILYRCKDCRSCIHFKRNIPNHECITNSQTAKCKLCNERIRYRNIKGHMERHQENPDFNVNNFIIKIFDPFNNTSQSEDDFELVKQEQRTINSKKTKKKKNNLSKTVSSVTTKVTKSPDAKVTSTKSKAHSNVSTGTKVATIYKCDCGLHYTSLKNIEEHVQTCDSDTDISKENCSKCGLLFPTNVLVSHLCKHHSKNSKFTVELYQKHFTDVDNVESTSESPSPVKKPRFKSQVKLYKCSKCNVCFVNQNTCYKHVYKNHQPVNPRHCIDCKLCGLQFTLNTLTTHVNRHHSNELSLDNILIEEYQPVVGKGPPKRETYVASDKVQSLQVTSSIEEQSNDR